MAKRANWIDRTISFFSPTAGLRRAKARYVESHLRAYDGASTSRRTENWNATGTSANAETRYALKPLRERSRELVRNDPYAARAVSVIANNVVGTGIIPQARCFGEATARSKKFDGLWSEWANSLKCDFENRHSLYGLQGLAMRAIVESGELLVKRVRVDSKAGLKVPLQLQILEPDFIDHLREGRTEDGNFIIQGIEFDKSGKVAAYWLFNQHPGDNGVTAQLRGIISVRTPASEILHIFRTDRPGQVRGVPWFAAALMTIKDYSDFSDATLLRQKIAACFTAFVKDLENGNDLTSVVTPPLGEKVEPGLIEILPPGRDITFSSPPAPEGFAEFSRSQLRAIAVGLGISYEALSGDLSQVNFSSGRMGALEMQRNIDVWRWQMFIPQFCDGIWDWFTEAAAVAGFGTQPVGATWTAPRREMIDPTREIAAVSQAIRI